MELHQVRYFLAVCDELNFTKAAKASNVTQPALTKAIKHLEFELGGELFDRQARPIKLTDLGTQLRSKFESIHRMAKEINADARLFASLDRAVYTLGILNTIGNKTFTKLVERVQRHQPGIALSLKLVDQRGLIKDLEQGRLELALLANVPKDLTDFTCVKLYEEDYVAAIPRGHRLTSKNALSLSDLHGAGYIERTHCEKAYVLESIFAKSGIEISTRLSTDQDQIAKTMVEAGLGFTLFPRGLAQGDMEIRTVEDLSFSREIVLVQQANRKLSPSAEAIKEQIVKLAV
ncbi:MAG: LysR family transcriptional regulator [Kordiimonadaceae bacterium]|nr:LysR family transcriptional regulator [Kordiimonadaceae bacterium]MBO6567696.1 LysR family transcriptional regulator [Kordiimonadaceae bacterium]MBO6963090.1 LysR family transcriptional regulator [Kordiimonadaceae bacterium]